MKIYTFDNKIMTLDGKWMEQPSAPPAPSLPPYTIRLKFTEDGYIPTFSKGTGVKVSSSPNIWDLTYENPNWAALLSEQTRLIEVIDANTTGVTDMSEMFAGCEFMTTVQLFDTSSVTNMYRMFRRCGSLTTIPLFDTSSATNMNYTFQNCNNVQSGALALYRQASSQATVPTHTYTFFHCGNNTTTGAAELAQIPSDWK